MAFHCGWNDIWIKIFKLFNKKLKFIVFDKINHENKLFSFSVYFLYWIFFSATKTKLKIYKTIKINKKKLILKNGENCRGVSWSNYTSPQTKQKKMTSICWVKIYRSKKLLRNFEWERKTMQKVFSNIMWNADPLKKDLNELYLERNRPDNGIWEKLMKSLIIIA